ncbi:MAG: DUF3160 domain-containing protein [Acidimicrobiia bacterium]|nr:DUF3160 domain-containing protein [Acidimicrobiia bacterium]
MHRPTALLVVAVLTVTACTGTGADTTNPPSTTLPPSSTTHAPPVTTSTQPVSTTTVPIAVTASMQIQPRPMEAFAQMDDIPLLGDTPLYAGLPLPSSLAGVTLSPPVQALLDGYPDVESALLANGFVVVPGWASLFQNVYGQFAYDNHAMFVTTDIAYHYLHLAFSKVLRDSEEVVLLPILEEFVLGSLEATRDQALELKGTGLEEAADRAEQLLEATATLLGIDVGPIGPLAQEEVALALEGVAFVPSPITSFVEGSAAVSAANLVDYSLFKPRGHYTRSADLERYFRAMSMLGQGSFFLNDSRSLQIGALVARAVFTDPDLVDAWTLIYEPTAFMVGLADDYTPLELLAIVDDLAPGLATDPVALADLDLIERISTDLAQTRAVGINPEAAAVRIMGARFVIDSFVLDQLGWPSVGEPPPEKHRVSVSPLDVAAVMGSNLALEIQRAAEEPAYLHYEEQLASLRDLLATRTINEWAATVYDAWLYALQPKWSEKTGAFPDFMQTPAWTAKDLMTGLGSYTELKHDTILYAKQAVLNEGGGDWIEQEPRHWVEPDPVAFFRVAQVALLLRDGLDDRGLLTEEHRTLLNDLISFVDRLGGIAGDELAGRPVSTADNDWLEAVATTMEALWLASSDIDPATGLPSSLDSMDALIADIARSSFLYLEIGTGYIDRLLVLVPTDDGRFQVAEGGVYSYYEFWRPEEEGRLTDEEWRSMLQASWDSGADTGVPDRFEPVPFGHPDGGERLRPAWQTAFLVEAG